MEITNENYFDDPRISQSMLKDYIACPYYFEKKHIEKVVEDSVSDSMIIGSALDCLVTEGEDVFNSKYECVERRSKTASVSWEYQLNNTQISKVMLMGDRIKSQPIMRDLFGGSETQKILYTKKRKGKLDFLKVSGAHGIIADLKTTSNLEKIRHVVSDYHYHFQMAYYRALAKMKNRNVKTWDCYLIVIDTGKYARFGVYKLDPVSLDWEESYIKKIIARLSRGSKNIPSDSICTVCLPEWNCPNTIVGMHNIETI